MKTTKRLMKPLNVSFVPYNVKKFLTVILCSLIFFPCIAQQQKVFSDNSRLNTKRKPVNAEIEKTWNYLQRAKREYDSGNLSEALVLANKATDTNAAYYLSLHDAIAKASNRKSILAMGDKITDVYNKLYELEDFKTCALFDEVFLLQSIKELSDSMENLYIYLKKRAGILPESAYIIGRVFEAQGEFSQAKNYYNKAWAQKDFLETPDEKIHILYSLAAVHEALGERDEFEKFLLSIAVHDALYAQKNTAGSSLRAMLKTLKENKTTQKFFILYRHDGDMVLEALQKLTLLYCAEGAYDKALETSACAVCIVTTELERYIKMKNFLFEYTTLSNLILQCGNDSIIQNWASDKKFWETYLQFADVLYTLQYASQAEDVYASVASSIPDYYLAQRAFYAIQKIQTDRSENASNETNNGKIKHEEK